VTLTSSVDRVRPASPAPRLPERARLLVANNGGFVLLAVLLIIAAVTSPRFFSEAAMRNTSRQAAVLGVVVIGQVLVMIVRCIDLSVSAVIGFTVVLVAEGGPGLAPGIAWAAAIAIAVGLVNGWLVTHRQVPPFVATFGMLVLLGGARFAYTRGSTSGRVHDGLIDVVRHSFGPVTVPVIAWIGLTIVASAFIVKTANGRGMTMAGANEEMGRLSGLPVDRYKFGAFISCSLLAALAGVLLAGSTGYVDRSVGLGTELDSITAALLGGASFSGGEGSFIGGAIGSLLLASLFTLIVLHGWSTELQLVAKGIVLVGALAVGGVLRRRGRT
jgi:ribose/xylose/arabinose/galactoside ABC-type transport system permease subunit